MTAAQDQVEGGEAASQFSDAHRQLLGDNSIQFELPTAQYSPSDQQSFQQAPLSYNPGDPSAVPQPNGRTVPVDPSVAPPAQARPPDLPDPAGGGGMDVLMQVFLWLAAGIALAILLYLIFTFFRDRSLGAREGKVRR